MLASVAVLGLATAAPLPASSDPFAYITNQGMTAEAAGEKWAKEHESTWKAWMP